MFLELVEVSFSYMQGTPLAQPALKNINFYLKQGEFVGLIGPTGSGKSTLIQHFNGLLFPSQGKVFLEGKEIGNGYPPNLVRRKVGLVFQFPESQLFGETVFEDVAFGPRNLGYSESEVQKRVKRALEMVGLDFEAFKERFPFSLSGGEMRRVALAGVLSMEPEILVLDEPTSGLDSEGRREILSYLKYLHSQRNLTIVLSTHNMDEVASLAQRLIVLDKGEIIFSGSPKEVFLEAQKLRRIGLDIPQTTSLLLALRAKGVNISPDLFGIEETKEALLTLFKLEG